MEHLPINDDKLLTECEPDDKLLPVIVNVFSLNDMGVVLETHVNNTLQTIDQCSSPAVKTVANDTSAKPTLPSRTRVRKFACTYCRKKFHDKNGVEAHIRIHTGEKPFSCHYCDYSSARKQDLNRHLRKHREEKPFSCDVCSKSFADSSGLKQHLVTHKVQKSHKCDLCAWTFKKESNLDRHYRTHSKPFGCYACGKMFAESRARDNHYEHCSLLKKYNSYQFSSV